MYIIESSETKLTDAEKRVLASVMNWQECGPSHVQSRQLRTARNLVKKGYLREDDKFCYSGGYYWSSVECTVLNRYAYGKEIHVSPGKKQDN